VLSDVPPYRRVVVPLDGSDVARDAIPVGRRLARLHRCELWLTTLATPATTDETAERILQAGCRRAELTEAHTLVLHGDDAAVELARFDREHPDSLLCLTTRGRTSVGRLLFGSVSRALVRASDQVQVLVGPSCAVDADTDAPIENLVVCLDGTRDAESILRWATAWASTTDVGLVLVHVAYPLPPPEARVTPTPEQLGRLRYLDRVARRLRTDGIAVRDVLEQHTDAHDAILDIAANVPHAVLAVATGHPGPVGEMLVGSTAARLLRASPSPVLVASRAGAARPVSLV